MSQGAFIGALCAKSPDDFESLMDASCEMANELASAKEKFLDLMLLRMTSMLSGRRFNNAVQKLLGTMQIQDLILDFFCCVTDVQRRQVVVHSKWVLWKCVWASMSLMGCLPLVSEDGLLLVDGGHLNIVPAYVMQEQFCAKTVIAVDAASKDECDCFDYGMHLSFWWLLWNSWNPFAQTAKVPSMGDISKSLHWVSSDQHRKAIVHATDLHLRPPVQEHGTLECRKFDEIVEKGHLHAKPIIDNFVK